MALVGAATRNAERRQITVFFSDLSGFTAMSECLDPEDVQSVMKDIFDAAAEIVAKYGGRVDKLLGDAVMAVFGDPVAHEDDAERAVRAVLEIHAFVDQLSHSVAPKIGRPLIMHSGINTGVVVTSASAYSGPDTGPLGDTINLAARLEDLSEAGEILLGPETAPLVGHVFELEDYGRHDLKGKTGLTTVTKVTGFRQNRGAAPRPQAVFVGRHEELGILLAAVEKVQDGQGSVIGIRAEAGAGKTRLLEEFNAQVGDRVQWLEGRAYAFGENIPFAPLVDLISNAVGITEDDTQDSIAAKLTGGVSELVADLDRILDPFHRLFGLPARAGAAIDKDSFQDRLLESLTAVVEGLCRRAPTVLVLQDLHWADPSTVGIFSSLVTQVTSPVVIVANYRPGFNESLPGLREIELAALSPRQSAALISSLLNDGQPPPEVVDFVVERTDGNPFYLEEIVNSLLETSILTEIDGQWQLNGSLDEASIPTSVRGVIAARIDRLDPARRKVLQEASVVGRDFLYEVIRRVAVETETLDPSLTDLQAADLIRQRQNQSDVEYFFKHALTQDVAYEGLLKPERAKLHARAATAIEEQFAGRLEEVTETLAYHYRQASDLEKSVHYLRAAGRKAMERYALVEAQAHFEAAYELLADAERSAERDRRLVETILDWAILFYYRARLLALDDLMERHGGVIDRLDDERLRMWWFIWRGHAAGFQLDQNGNMKYLDAAVEIGERIGDETGVAYAKTWKVWGYFVSGDPTAGIATAGEIEEWVTANRYDDPYPYLKSRGTLAYVLASAGHYAGVRDMCDELIRFGHEVGNNRCIAYGHQGLAFLDTITLNFNAGIAASKQGKEIAKDPIYAETANLTRAAAAVFVGDTVEARQAVNELRTVVAAGVNLPAPLFVALADGVAMIGEGHLTEGMDSLFDTRAEAETYQRTWEYLFAEVYIGAIYARMVSGEATRDLGKLMRNPRFIKYIRRAKSEAPERLNAAIDGARACGFHGLVPIAEFELAKFCIHTGEVAEAKRLLESALDMIGRAGESAGTAMLRSLLAGL